jgi:hypothetical protein
MTEPTYRIEPLTRNHNRQGFDCGNEVLNRFLQQYASQWARRDIAQTYVIVDIDDPHTIVGYYSDNATRLDLEGVDVKGIPSSVEIGPFSSVDSPLP